MKLNISTDKKEPWEIFNITKERHDELLDKAAGLSSIFKMRSDPILGILVDALHEKAPSKYEEQLVKEQFGSEDNSYYRNGMNLFKEMVGLCDNLEEVVMIMPAAVLMLHKKTDNVVKEAMMSHIFGS